MTATAEEFGRRLCFARLALGWTQQDLADKSGVPQKSITGYERGVNEPGLFKAAALAAALGMTLDDLAGLTGGTP